MPTHRARRWTGRSGAASRACPAVQRRRPGARDAAPGSTGAGSSRRSRDHRRATAHRRPRPLSVDGGRSRVDPGAAEPLRPVGQRGDGQPDPQSVGVQADATRGALADQLLPTLQTEVRQRIVLAESVADGRLARELAPDSAAAREVSSLVDELLRWSP